MLFLLRFHRFLFSINVSLLCILRTILETINDFFFNVVFLWRGSAKLLTLTFLKSLRSSILILSFNLKAMMPMESLALLSHNLHARESCWFYIKDLSRIQPLLTSSTTLILVQATILSHLQEPPPRGCFHPCSPAFCSWHSSQDGYYTFKKYKLDQAIHLQEPLLIWPHITSPVSPSFCSFHSSQSAPHWTGHAYLSPKAFAMIVPFAQDAFLQLSTLLTPHFKELLNVIFLKRPAPITFTLQPSPSSQNS